MARSLRDAENRLTAWLVHNQHWVATVRKMLAEGARPLNVETMRELFDLAATVIQKVEEREMYGEQPCGKQEGRRDV